MAEECAYYYWDAGYSCSLQKRKTGNSTISSDTVYRYCWGYHYEDCPLYKNRDSGGGCFLTSACVEAKNLPDDCRELTVLRSFRDNYMRNTERGSEEICEYYHVAPAIVEKIKALPDAVSIFENIYNQLVLPCVELIDRGENELAHSKYRDYVNMLRAQYSV